jgi:hypothetical protein
MQCITSRIEVIKVGTWGGLASKVKDTHDWHCEMEI